MIFGLDLDSNKLKSLTFEERKERREARLGSGHPAVATFYAPRVSSQNASSLHNSTPVRMASMEVQEN